MITVDDPTVVLIEELIEECPESTEQDIIDREGVTYTQARQIRKMMNRRLREIYSQARVGLAR